MQSSAGLTSLDSFAAAPTQPYLYVPGGQLAAQATYTFACGVSDAGSGLSGQASPLPAGLAPVMQPHGLQLTRCPAAQGGCRVRDRLHGVGLALSGNPTHRVGPTGMAASQWLAWLAARQTC